MSDNAIVSDKILLAPLFHLELVKDRDIPYDGNATTTEGAAQVLHNLLDRSPVEQLVVLYLGSDGKIIGAEKVGTGTLEMVGAQPQEIFRGAITHMAASIILSHNHPSGAVRPSSADLKFTMGVVSSGAMLGIRVHDHIIVGPGGQHMSLYDNQHLFENELASGMSMIGNIPTELKKALLSILEGSGIKADQGKLPKKGGDPTANAVTNWKRSLSYAMLSR